MMLELLWVSKPDEVKSELTKPTMFWERWNGRKHTSPFGMVFRSSNREVPFEGWGYKPKYVPGGLSFWVGNNAGMLNEPIIFKKPHGGRPTPKKNPPLHNLSGFQNVSSLRVKMPQISSHSSILRSIGKLETISFEESKNHLMEIRFDEEICGKSKNFFPELPRILKW